MLLYADDSVLMGRQTSCVLLGGTLEDTVGEKVESEH